MYIFTAARGHQISDISQLESLVSTSQDLVRKHTREYMEKVDKLVKLDTTIKQLITDNQKLTEEINVIKKIWQP